MSCLINRSLLFPCAMAAGLFVGLLLPGPADAAKKAEQSRTADQYVAEALHREIYGQHDQRDELLKKALNESSDCKSALWHSGHVEVNREWVKVDEVPRMTASDKRFVRYKAQREEAEDTVAGNLGMANWCREYRLPDQERAHLTRVLELETDHAEARRRLGYVRVEDEWMTRDEIVEARKSILKNRKSFLDWKPRLVKLRDNVLDRSKKQRDYATAQLKEITDATAIPGIEAILSTHSEPMAQLAVEIVSGIASPEASLSLARHAIYSKSDSVREAAARKLKDRPLDEFVPSMLASMRSPILTQREVLQGGRNRFTYRHAFYREGQENRELSVLDTEYRRISVPGGSRRDTLERALEDVRSRAEARERVVNATNEETVELNHRVMDALELVTDQNIFNSPQQWWEWWNLQNEVYVSGPKELATSYRQEEVAIADRSALAVGLVSGALNTIAGGGAYDCLAAGTLVWTDAGPQPIEKIQVGDRVLSQDPESGELAFKPVLSTTVRPPSKLTRIGVGSEEIVTSGGHLFWVSGDGWVKSRQVKDGAQLHTVDGASAVSFVDKAPKAETYNLVVADFHTYFVGEAKLLCHDNTVRRTTSNVVPGLTAE